MGYADLLFNPNGRIGKNTFWRGAIAVLVITIVISIVGAYVPGGWSIAFGLLSFALVYPYLCVYGKRIHDAGLSAWIFVALLIGYFILSYFIGQFLLNMMAGEANTAAQEAMRVASQSGDIGAVMQISRDLSKQTLVPSIITLIICNAILAAVPGELLKEDPEDNTHGLAPGA